MNTPFNTMADVAYEADGDEIEAMLEEQKFDIIHFHEPWVPLLSRQILVRSKSINIGTFHAKLPESIVSKSIMNTVGPYTKSTLGYFHAYTAVSDAGAELIRDMTTETVHIIPNGIELSRFEGINKHKNSSKKKILYLGRLEKRKGVDYLIRAYEDLRHNHDDVELIIAGKGVKDSYLKKIVSQNNIPDVTFMGYIKEEDKAQLMAVADVFCSPAIYGESFGIVLLEAMAVGTPIIAGNNSGYSSLMTGKGRLSLVNPKSQVDFTHKLELMLYDKDIIKLWKNWAKTEVQKYDFKLVAKQYENLYERALKIHA
jgi:phosphatidylinositol alpha-mannosyltransferase